MLGRSAGLVLVAAISTMGNAAAFELRHTCVSTSAFQANSGVSHRRAAYVSCRRTRFFHLSDAGGPASHIEAGTGSQSEQALQSKAVNGVNRVDRALLTDEHTVQKMPMKPLQFKGVGAMPHCKSEAWKARITHVLDGMSALFSLGCVSATLACMGILEWSTLATLVVLLGSFSTAIGSLMVLATAAVSILAVLDTLRAPGGKKTREIFTKLDVDGSGAIDAKELRAIFKGAGDAARKVDVLMHRADVDGNGQLDYDEFARVLKVAEDDPLNALAAPPRRLGSTGTIISQRLGSLRPRPGSIGGPPPVPPT